jgi:AcrR family transcriptional regulator
MAKGTAPGDGGDPPEGARPKAAEEPELLWLRPEPSDPRSAHSRDEIAAAALEIAAGEGFEAISMRRVAQQLGAGTMTLYNYVRNKDELITLMADAALGEALVPPGELDLSDWQVALRQIALRMRATFQRHRWVLDRVHIEHPIPNGLRIFEQYLRACSSLEVSDEEKVDVIALIDDYVYGFVLHEGEELEEQRRGWPPEVLTFLQRQLGSEDLANFRRFLGDDIEAGLVRAGQLFLGEGRFERGLDRLLAGAAEHGVQ